MTRAVGVRWELPLGVTRRVGAQWELPGLLARTDQARTR